LASRLSKYRNWSSPKRWRATAYKMINDFVAGKSFAEIAEHYGCNQEDVKRMIQWARKNPPYHIQKGDKIWR